MRNVFFTVGHATRPIGAFLDLLRQVEILTVADVRSVPEPIPNSIVNSWLDRLAPLASNISTFLSSVGLRSKQKDVPVAVNAFWQNQSFHNAEGAKPGPDDVLTYPADL